MSVEPHSFTPSVPIWQRNSFDERSIDVAGIRSVLVFIKEPRPGKVKTRLAAAIGDHEAARLYEQWTTLILNGLQPLRASSTLIGYYDGDELVVRDRWDLFCDSWLRQPGGDLGERLDFGFVSRLRHGPAAAVGTDCLDVDAAVVESAFAAMGTAGAVLGPASDGGYYLIGLKRTAFGVFSGIEWSSPRTFIQQRDALIRTGMTISELPMLHDIDTIDDWHAYLARPSQ